MKREARHLKVEQLDMKLSALASVKTPEPPPRGWIHATRTALNMSLAQLGNRLGITPASVREIEEREQTKSITLKKLAEVGAALDLQFVYGFIPRRGSVEAMIEARALEIARDVVGRTSHSMKLEDQENSEERLRKSIRQQAETLRREIPRYLWD